MAPSDSICGPTRTLSNAGQAPPRAAFRQKASRFRQEGVAHSDRATNQFLVSTVGQDDGLSRSR